MNPNIINQNNSSNNSNDYGLLEQVNQCKNEYYSNQSKNMLFKKSQKLELAKQMSEKIDINHFLKNFTYNIPNTENIFIDYTIFKLFANESNYQVIINYFLDIIDYCIFTYGRYTLHLNMDSFTVSAAERYYTFLELYVSFCLIKSKTNKFLYSEKLNKFNIYNPPNVLDMIHKILKKVIQKEVNEKIVVIPKKESKEALENILNFQNVSSLPYSENNEG